MHLPKGAKCTSWFHPHTFVQRDRIAIQHFCIHPRIHADTFRDDLVQNHSSWHAPVGEIWLKDIAFAGNAFPIFSKGIQRRSSFRLPRLGYICILLSSALLLTTSVVQFAGSLSAGQMNAVYDAASFLSSANSLKNRFA